MGDHRVIHSSYVQLPQTQTISPDTRAPAIGIIVKQHDQSRSNILVSMPRLTSIESGEFAPTEETETTIREKALEIEERCRLLSAELLRHAKRMYEVATRVKVVDDASPVEVSKSSGPRYVEVQTSFTPPPDTPIAPVASVRRPGLSSSLLASMSKFVKGDQDDD